VDSRYNALALFREAHIVVVVLILAIGMLAVPIAASAALPAEGSSVDAPGLSAGPFLGNAGLVWEGPEGIMLTGSAAKSTVLAPSDAPNWDNFVDLAWFGADWWVVAEPSGVFAGEIGGELSELPVLRRCNPATPTATPESSAPLYAVSGEHLYAVLPAHCFIHPPARREAVVDIDLRSHHWHVLPAVPGNIALVAASGKYLAIAYMRGPPRANARTRSNLHREKPQLFVRVLNARTGTTVNQVTPPPDSPERDRTASGIQVDNQGDVLVSAGCCAVAPGALAHVAQPVEISAWWWARAGARVGREVELGSDAVLSDGRVAFFSTDENETIDVVDLLTDTRRTIVSFSGSMHATSLAFSGNGLTWAQQSSVIEVVTAPGFQECRNVALSPVELASLDLRFVPSSPISVSGAPIPAQYANQPPCIRA
jgi:hypothetical protein